MADAGLLSVKITADDSQLVAALSRARASVRQTGDQLREGISTFAKYGAAAATAGLAIGVGLVTHALDAIDTQAKLARQLGGTTASVQALERAGDLAGVSTESLTKAAGGLNVKLGQAMAGTGTAVDALTRLHLTAEGLSKLDADERMAKIADAIKEQGLNAQQTAAVMRDLGIKQAELISLFEGGGAAIRAARKEIEGYGVAVSEIDAAKIEAGNDALTSIKLTLNGIATQVSIAVAPVLQEIGDRFAGAAKESGGFRDVTIPALQGIAKGAAYVGDMLQGINVVWEMLSTGALYLKADVLTAYEAMTTGVAKVIDFSIAQVNLLISALNLIPNVEIQPIKLASQSDTIKGIHDVAQAARDEARSADEALHQLAMAKMPTDNVDEFFDAVQRRAEAAAKEVVKARGTMAGDDWEDPQVKKGKDDKADTAENKINSIKLGAAPDDGKLLAELQEKYQQLNDIIAEQPQLQQQAAEAAGMLAQQYQNSVDAQIAAGQAGHQAFIEQMSARVETIKTQNETEIEIALERYATDQEILEEALLNRVITEQEYNDISAQQQADHEAKLGKMRLSSWKDMENLSKLSWKTQLTVMTGTLAEMTAGLASKSRTMFEINKAAAIANTAVRIPEMAVSAYNAMAGIPYVGPVLGAIAAAAAIGYGATQISAISSTSFGGGAASPSSGTPSAATSQGAGSGAAGGSSQTQTLAVQGLDSGSLFDGKTVRALVEKLVDFQRDGGKVVFTA